MSSTPPIGMRFFLLNADPDERILVVFPYTVRQRIEVRHDGNFIIPQNMYEDKKGRLQYRISTNKNEFIPTIANHSGSNYFDTNTGLLYLIVGGSKPYNVTMKPIILLGMGVSVSVDDFYGKDVVSALATLLGVSQDRVRVVDAVNENDARRRKRSPGDNIRIQLEISQLPGATNATSSEELQKVADTLIEMIQTGYISKSLNITLDNVLVTPPIPGSNESQWSLMVQQLDSGMVNDISVAVVTDLHIQDGPQALHEGLAFPIQPKVKIVDENVSILITVCIAAV